MASYRGIFSLSFWTRTERNTCPQLKAHSAGKLFHRFRAPIFFFFYLNDRPIFFAYLSQRQRDFAITRK